MMTGTEEQAHSLLPSLTDFVGCAHSGKTLSCSRREPPPGYACVTTPRLSEEKATTMRRRKKAASALLASPPTAPAAAAATSVALHFWDGGGRQEERSAAWREISAWCWSYQLCGQREVEERRWSGRGCEPGGTEGCCRQICSAQSGTGGGVWETGRAGSWASCGERRPGSSGCWTLGSCSGRRCLRGREEINFKGYIQHFYANKFK